MPKEHCTCFKLIQEKKSNAHSGKKDLLKCLFRKKKGLIWNQGLKEDFFLSDIKPEKAFKSVHTLVQVGSLVPAAQEAKTGLGSQKGLSPQR